MENNLVVLVVNSGRASILGALDYQLYECQTYRTLSQWRAINCRSKIHWGLKHDYRKLYSKYQLYLAFNIPLAHRSIS